MCVQYTHCIRFGEITMSKKTKSSVQKERTKEQIDKLLIKIPDAKLPGYCQHKGRIRAITDRQGMRNQFIWKVNMGRMNL